MNNTLRGTRRVAAGLIAALTALSASVAAATAASASTTSGAGTSAHTSASARLGTTATVSTPASRAPSLAKIAMLEQRAKIAAHARASRQGAITGRVVGFDSRPVTGACVTAVGRAGSVTAAAAPDGTFRLADLAAGSYALEYRDCSAAGRNLTSASGYLTTWSGGTSTQISAARVQVTAGQIRHVPLMMLRPANPAAAIAAGQASFRRELAANGRTVSAATAAKTGKISGKVTGKGKALRGICVTVISVRNGQGYGATTSKNGTYTVRHVAAGRYHVIFAAPFFCPAHGNWLEQVYKDDNKLSALFGQGGTVVKVRAGHKVTGIDANLRLGGQISGTVTSKSGAKLRGICVSTFGALGSGDFFGFGSRTAANGSYHLHALFPGKYSLQFSIGCGSHGSNYAPATHRAVKIRLGQRLTVNQKLAPGASITGTVTLTSSSGTPLSGICVFASNASGSVSDFTSTNNLGDYQVIGLTGGRYQLQFSTGCKNQGNYTTTFVTTQTKAGRQTSGVNAVLQAGGTISGVVTDSHGKPVPGICIQLDGANSYTAMLPDSTGEDGSYAITGLSAGTYEVGFFGGCGNSGNYAPTWYQNQPDESLATPITVSTGGTATADQQMLPGATISGKVTDASGHRLSGVCVSAATEMQAELGSVFTQAAFTEHGTYTISGLAPGQYLIDFGCGQSSKYADQWFPGAPDAGAADLVSAGPGRTTGINAVLHLGGSISGVVTNKAGHPLAGICASATRVGTGISQLAIFGGINEPITGSHGTYKISGLAAGRYDVSFSPCSGRTQQYAQQTATAVRVREGKTTTGIDGHLVVGGALSGRVVNASGAPLRNICVFAFDNRTGSFGFATTGKAGTYRARGVSTGSYTVEFSPCANQNYVPVFGHARVTAPHATTGVNATMRRGGSIAGVVTQGSASGPPAADVCVDVVSSDPNNPGGFGFTGPDGSYLATGLAAGTYQVFFDPTCLFTAGPGLAPQWYDDQPTQATAKSVPVMVGLTTPSIDAALQSGGFGEITGTVSGKSTGPLSGACVTAVPLPAGSALPVLAVTRSGGYTLADLTPGRYKVKFSAGCGAAGYVTQWWQQKTSQKTATVIRVGSGQDTSGISATLGKSG